MSYHRITPSEFHPDYPELHQQTPPTNHIYNVAQASFYLLKLSWHLAQTTISSAINYSKTRLYPEKELTSHQKLQLHQTQCSEIKKIFCHQIEGQIVLKEKSTTHLFRPRQQTTSKLDLHSLNRVISIDENDRIAHVQGMVSFDDLVKETLKIGLMPKVVPELRKITVGGAISGLAVESSSFKYGLVHRTVNEMEILTGTGQILTCTPNNEYKDLFYGIPNSYGTLGYILSAKFELMPVKPYVEIYYKKYQNIETFFLALANACTNSQCDFIDGVIFSPTNMVMVLAKGVEEASHCSNYVENGIYYKALQEKERDYLTIQDYIWRWDHDSFWSTKGTPLQIPWVRKIFGRHLLHSDKLSQLNRFLKEFNKEVIQPFTSENGKKEKEELIQDLGIPIDRCAEFYHWFREAIGIHPIFICPVKPDPTDDITPLWQLPRQDTFHCNFGFYDSKEVMTSSQIGYYNRLIEQRVLELDGLKSLYSRVYYDQLTFEELYYGGSTYSSLKHQYDPNQRFLSLFEKCVKGK